MRALPDGPDHRRTPADTASCSALAASLQHEAATLSALLEQLTAGSADRRARRELADVVDDLRLLAGSLQRHVSAQSRARGLSAQWAISEQGRGRQVLLRASRRVCRAPGKYRDVP